MFTSEHKDKTQSRIVRNYLIIAGFCAIFSTVYEFFSHGVLSFFMIGLFLFPLAGAILFFIPGHLSLLFPDRTTRGLLHAGIATLGVGSCLAGVLEIYGTDSAYIPVYWGLGILLLCAGILHYTLSH